MNFFNKSILYLFLFSYAFIFSMETSKTSMVNSKASRKNTENEVKIIKQKNEDLSRESWDSIKNSIRNFFVVDEMKISYNDLNNFHNTIFAISKGSTKDLIPCVCQLPEEDDAEPSIRIQYLPCDENTNKKAASLIEYIEKKFPNSKIYADILVPQEAWLQEILLKKGYKKTYSNKKLETYTFYKN